MKTIIDKTKHYFCQMETFSIITPFGFGITSGNRSWVECEISEHKYKLEENYKVTLVPLDKRFAAHDFYVNDFELLLKDGSILEKTNENQHVEFVSWLENLTPTVNVEHTGYIVV